MALRLTQLKAFQRLILPGCSYPAGWRPHGAVLLRDVDDGLTRDGGIVVVKGILNGGRGEPDCLTSECAVPGYRPPSNKGESLKAYERAKAFIDAEIGARMTETNYKTPNYQLREHVKAWHAHRAEIKQAELRRSWEEHREILRAREIARAKQEALWAEAKPPQAPPVVGWRRKDEPHLAGMRRSINGLNLPIGVGDVIHTADVNGNIRRLECIKSDDAGGDVRGVVFQLRLLDDLMLSVYDAPLEAILKMMTRPGFKLERRELGR